MGAASVSEYVASLNEEQRRHISALFILSLGILQIPTNC